MCTHLGCIFIICIVIIILLSLLFVVVEVWNKSVDRPNSYKIKAIVGILFSIVILVCILVRSYLDHKRRDIREVINVILFFTCWALLVWTCICGVFSKKEAFTTEVEERILLRTLNTSRTDITRLNLQPVPTTTAHSSPIIVGITTTTASTKHSPNPSPIKHVSPSHQKNVDRATMLTYENQIRTLRKQLRKYQFMLDVEEPEQPCSSRTNRQLGDNNVGGSILLSNRSLSGVDTGTQSSQLSFLSDNWEHIKDEKQRSNSFSGCAGQFIFPSSRIIKGHRSFPIKPWLWQPHRPPMEAIANNICPSNTAVPKQLLNESSPLAVPLEDDETDSELDFEVPEKLTTINNESREAWSPTSYDESMTKNMGTM